MLLSYGDALIDFMPATAADGRAAYVPAVGGSCLNVAVAMARLGAPAGFVGGISTDLFGAQIADHAEASGVDLRHASRPQAQTTLAFVKKNAAGDASYGFYDEGTATQRWRYAPGSIPFAEVDALHVGSTSLIEDPVSAEALRMADEASASTTVAFDPNCRPSLVRDRAAYRARMEAFADRAAIVRMSDADFAFLFEAGPEAFAAFAADRLARGASVVVMTEGERGARGFCRAGAVAVAAPKVAVADTIGAGDTFQGALLVALHRAGLLARDRLAAISVEDLRAALGFGVACAAITCSRPGADPPWAREVEDLWP